jgi:hypothetical protein
VNLDAGRAERGAEAAGQDENHDKRGPGFGSHAFTSGMRKRIYSTEKRGPQAETPVKRRGVAPRLPPESFYCRRIAAISS